MNSEATGIFLSMKEISPKWEQSIALSQTFGIKARLESGGACAAVPLGHLDMFENADRYF